MSTRYLLTFSYLGTKYKGMQRQSPRPNTELFTVQGAIENALHRLNPLSEPAIVLASRTDKGVHAAVNTAHTDLIPRNPAQSFHPDFITSVANHFLAKAKHDIIIRKTELVPHWFHSRHLAQARSYLYRIAVLKQHLALESISRSSYRMYLPIAELNQCFVVPQLDFARVHQAMELMSGTHDFRTFKNVSRVLEQELRPTVKDITTFELRPSGRLSQFLDPNYENVDMWEFYIRSKSFLYRQVRRMVSAVMYAGTHPDGISSIQRMLENPHKDSWDRKVNIVPPCGLFLTSIEYDRQHFNLDAEPPEIITYYDKFRNGEESDECDESEDVEGTEDGQQHEAEKVEERS